MMCVIVMCVCVTCVMRVYTYFRVHFFMVVHVSIHQYQHNLLITFTHARQNRTTARPWSTPSRTIVLRLCACFSMPVLNSLIRLRYARTRWNGIIYISFSLCIVTFINTRRHVPSTFTVNTNRDKEWCNNMQRVTKLR